MTHDIQDARLNFEASSKNNQHMKISFWRIENYAQDRIWTVLISWAKDETIR